MRPHRLRQLVDEPEDRPIRKGKGFTLPPKRPRMYKPRRLRIPILPPDIDMMKYEARDGDFCGCGQRKIDGAICMRCFGE